MTPGQVVSTAPTVVCLNGSENSYGSTAAVLDHFSETLAGCGVKTEIISLAEHKIVPCGPCGDCNWRAETCEVEDDVRGIVERTVSADGVVYGAPVHAFGLPSRMQTFVERAGVGHLRFARPLTDKVGGAIVVGRRYAHTNVLAQLHHNMLLNRMILPGSGNAAMVTTELGSPLDDVEGIAAVDALAHRMAEVILRLRDVASVATSLAVNERVR